jgi:transcriptional regulator with XRE-family HTH domain
MSSPLAPGTPEEPHSIGERIRSRRRALRMTLSDVASQASISEGFLSQIERDRNTASVSTLQRICKVLQLTVGDLFAPASTPTVHRYSGAQFNRYGENARKVSITPGTNKQVASFIGEFEPYGSTGDNAYAHGESEEFLLVLSGRLEVTIGDQVHILNPLDSVSYSSATPHGSREIDGKPAQALWVMSPPSY